MNEDIVRTVNEKLILNGKPFRFFGVNMYELAYVDDDVMAKMLNSAADQGFNAVRFWAFASMPVDKLRRICKHSSTLNLKLIPVFADMNEYLQGFRANDEWFKSGFREKYMKHVESIVNESSGSHEIMLWEIFNEPVTSDFKIIYDFVTIVSERIKEIDPLHVVSIGTIGGVGDKFGNELSRLSYANFKKLYSISALDAVSLHDYSFSSSVLERADLYYRLKARSRRSLALNKLDTIIGALPDVIDETLIRNFGRTFDFPFSLRSIWKFYNQIDFLIAKSLGKPVYIGEIGVKKKYRDLRKAMLEIQLRKHFDSGISGAMLWSFETNGRSLDGHDYGFDEKDGFGELAKTFLK
jgi:endo-1,4-beta-mannosidase